jgi:RNA polymerase sigma-70 factor (ECF subfamily)
VTPDSELIARVLATDDRPAFGELVRRHQSAVRGFLRHLLRDDDATADDLAQETFLQAYRRLDRFHVAATFSTWLLGIAYNYYRNERRRRGLVTPVAEPEPAATGPSHTAASDLRHDLTQALHHLSGDEQLAVHLAYQQGLSHSEIADVASWPVGTVKTHLARAKDKLRELLAVWNPQT